MLKILSPEISYNEKKKRDHKDFLIKVVQIFLIGQFIILGLLIFGIIGAFITFHALGNDFSIEGLKLVIHFVSLYITSVIVELIAMLNYIISRVFDTSITGLVELYKDKESSSKEESKKDK